MAKIDVKEKKDVLLVIFTVLCLLNLVVVFFLRTESSRILADKEKINYLQNLQKEGFSEEFWQKMAKIETVFPSDKQVLELIKIINNSRSSFDSLQMKFESDEPMLNFSQNNLPIAFEISGTSQNVFDFVDMLLSSAFPIEITNMTVETDNLLSGRTKIVFKARLFVAEQYYQ